MPKFAQDVIDFHAAMQLPLLDMTKDAINSNLAVRKRLIDEEVLREFIPAYTLYWHAEQPTTELTAEVLDAVTDSVYVLLGTTIALESYHGTQVKEPSTLSHEWHYLSEFLTDLSYAYSLLENLNGTGEWQVSQAASLSAANVFHRCISRLIDLGYLMANAKFDLIWHEVHKTNMAKSLGPKVNGKQLKPEGWEPPNIKSILEGTV